MRKKSMVGLVLTMILAVVGCKTAEKKDHLVGKWEVNDIYRDGRSLIGPGFQGTTYWFRKDGIVKSWEHLGDTSEVEYTRRGDSLIWVTMDQDMVYMIDSLDENVLHLKLDQDGFKSLVMMRKLKEK